MKSARKNSAEKLIWHHRISKNTCRIFSKDLEPTHKQRKVKKVKSWNLVGLGLVRLVGLSGSGPSGFLFTPSSTDQRCVNGEDHVYAYRFKKQLIQAVNKKLHRRMSSLLDDWLKSEGSATVPGLTTKTFLPAALFYSYIYLFSFEFFYMCPQG